jgi:hypothetical protein
MIHKQDRISKSFLRVTDFTFETKSSRAVMRMLEMFYLIMHSVKPFITKITTVPDSFLSNCWTQKRFSLRY